MSTTNIICPHCQGTLACDDTELGMTANCPLCSTPFTLALAPPPAPQGPPSPAASAAVVATVATAPAPSSPAAPAAQAPPTPAASSSSPPPPQTHRAGRVVFLDRIREESSYRFLRSFLDTFQKVGVALGWLIIAGGVVYGLFTGSNNLILGLLVMVAAIGSGLLVIGLSFVAYEAAVVAVDIADTLIDQRR